MEIQAQHVLLIFGILPIMISGCSSARSTPANRVSGFRDVSDSNWGKNDNSRKGASVSVSESPVQTVAHQLDNTESESDGDSPPQTIHLPAPARVDILSMPAEIVPANGMTLETLEELALSTNPAIQQAQAATA